MSHARFQSRPSNRFPLSLNFVFISSVFIFGLIYCLNPNFVKAALETDESIAHRRNENVSAEFL